MPFARNVSLGVIPAILISVFLCTASNADAQVPVGANAYYTPNPVNSFTMTLYGFPGHVPTGTVSLQVEGASIGPVPLVNSTATLQPGINFAIGSHTAVLTYSGDDYYAPVSTPVSFDVPLPSLPMGQQATFAAGTPVPVNVYMYDQSGTVQGTISVSEGGTPLGSAPFNNAQQGALIVVNNLSPGVHTLTIHFAGNVSIPDGSFIITIEPTAVLTFGGGPLTGVVGSQIKIAVRLTDQLGVAVGLVVLVENGTVLDSTGIAAGGSAILNYPATTAGTHSLLVQFSGNRPAGDLPLSIP